MGAILYANLMHNCALEFSLAKNLDWFVAVRFCFVRPGGTWLIHRR